MLHGNGCLGVLCDVYVMEPCGGGEFNSCSFNIRGPQHVLMYNFAEAGFWLRGCV